MRIVNRKEFLSLPANTVFSKYEPDVFEGLMIKGATIFDGKTAIDFFYDDIDGAIEVEGSSEHGVNVNIDFSSGGRDGCFENEQLFAVYENDDVRALILRLALCLDETKGEVFGGHNYILNAESSGNTKVIVLKSEEVVKC